MCNSFSKIARAMSSGWTVAVLIALLGCLCFGTVKAISNALESARKDALKFMDTRIELEERVRELEEIIVFLEENEHPMIIIKKMTKGIRNKNPMNVVAMPNSNKWDGQIGKSEEGFAIFSSYEYGLRAGAKVLKKYSDKGIDTVDALIKKYCEGDVSKYIRFVCSRLGVTPTTKINIMERLPELMKAIVRYENGYDVFPDYMYIPYSIYR